MASSRMPAGRTHPSRLARPPALYNTGVIHMTLDPHEPTSALLIYGFACDCGRGIDLRKKSSRSRVIESASRVPLR